MTDMKPETSEQRRMDRPPPGSWIRLTETRFHEMLREKLAATGVIGDVFPMMVAHNVPHFVLRGLWPEQYEEFTANPYWAAFTVAEAGWKGSIDNLNSRLVDDREKTVAKFTKSYVVTCDRMLMLLRRDDAFALALVPRSPDQKWTSRDEVSVRMEDSEGGAIDHYIVEGETAIPARDYIPVPRKAYARLGLQIPRRELTSLALLCEPLMKFHCLGIPGAIREQSEFILMAREDGKISREHLEAAGAVLDSFFAECERGAIVLHPFWENAKKMRSFLVKKG